MGVRCNRLFNITINDFDAKKSTCCSRVLVVTELIVSGTQCIFCYAAGIERSLHGVELPQYWVLNTFNTLDIGSREGHRFVEHHSYFQVLVRSSLQAHHFVALKTWNRITIYFHLTRHNSLPCLSLKAFLHLVIDLQRQCQRLCHIWSIGLQLVFGTACLVYQEI